MDVYRLCERSNVTDYGTYTVTGDFPIQDSKAGGATVQPGGTVVLDLEQGKFLEGLGLVSSSDSDAGKPAVYACPACVADPDRKRPYKATTQDELGEHYADKHPAFAAPTLEELTSE